MALPPLVTRSATEKGIFLHEHGHRLVACKGVADVLHLGGVFFQFADGSYDIFMGANLDAILPTDLATTDILGRLALNVTARPSVLNSRYIDGYGMGRHLSELAFGGTVRTLTHVFGVETSPYMWGGYYHFGGVTNDYNPAADGRLNLGTVTTSSGAYSVTGGSAAAARAVGHCGAIVLRVPYRLSWDALMMEAFKAFPDADISEVAEKIVNTWRVVKPVVEKASPVPMMYIKLSTDGARWYYEKPTAAPDVASQQYTDTGAPGFFMNNGKVIVIPTRPTYATIASPLIEVNKIDGLNLRHFTRGLAAAKPTSAIAPTSLTTGVVCADMVAATTIDGSDNIPARPTSGGVPVDDEAYAAAIVAAADAMPLGAAFDKIRYPGVIGYGLTPAHAAILVSCGMNMGKYNMSHLIPIDPFQFGIEANATIKSRLKFWPKSANTMTYAYTDVSLSTYLAANS